MREILREYPIIIELISLVAWFIVVVGSVKNLKLTKKMKKQYGTDLVSKETSNETLAELKVTKRFIFIGFATVMIIRFIGVLIYIE